jgi:hypothetical protein
MFVRHACSTDRDRGSISPCAVASQHAARGELEHTPLNRTPRQAKQEREAANTTKLLADWNRLYRRDTWPIRVNFECCNAATVSGRRILAGPGMPALRERPSPSVTRNGHAWYVGPAAVPRRRRVPRCPPGRPGAGGTLK